MHGLNRFAATLAFGLLLVGGDHAVAQAVLLNPSVRDVYSIGGTETGFAAVQGLAFTPSGDLVVLDKDRVVVLDKAGRQLSSWGRTGEGPGEFRRPLSIAASNSTVLVGGPGRVGEYSLDGSFLKMHSGLHVFEFAFSVGFANETPLALLVGIITGSRLVRLTDGVSLWETDTRFAPDMAFRTPPLMASFSGSAVVTTGAEYSMEVVNVETGEKVGEIVRDVDVRSVTPEFQTRMRRYLANPATAPDGWQSLVGGREEGVPEELLSMLRFPDKFPVVGRVFLGPGEALWVQRGIGVGDELAPPVEPPDLPFLAFDLFDASLPRQIPGSRKGFSGTR